MDGTLLFSLLALGMFGGSLISGLIPALFSIGSHSIKYIGLFGGGLLIGVTLVIIIPESVHELYHTNFHTMTHELGGIELINDRDNIH